MTKPLEALISSEISDFFAGVVDIHTELGGPNTIEEAQRKLTERVTRIATEHEAKLIAALEQSQKQNADLQRDELAAAAAKELRRVENLYTESQKRVAELEARHSKLRGDMAAIHNTIRLDGAGTSLSVILSASKIAYEESEIRVANSTVGGES